MAPQKDTDELNAKEFAIAFAISVTENANDPHDLIAKKGKDSIFGVLQEIFPEACCKELQRRRSKNQIARVELNKLIESQCGVQSVRVRRQSIASDAGDWLFRGRKWIDPADPDGSVMLDIHYHNLCILFPRFASACTHVRFIEAIAAVINRWSRHAYTACKEERSPGPDIATPPADEAADKEPPRAACAAPHRSGCTLPSGGPDIDLLGMVQARRLSDGG